MSGGEGGEVTGTLRATIYEIINILRTDFMKVQLAVFKFYIPFLTDNSRK